MYYRSVLGQAFRGPFGEGEFGSVHKAIYMTDDGEQRSVAVKVTDVYHTSYLLTNT